METCARFSWYTVCVGTVIVCLEINKGQNALAQNARADEVGKKPSAAAPGVFKTSVTPDFLKTWASYDELARWVKEHYPEGKPLIHYQGQQREMAVLFEQWPTGITRTHFTVYYRTNGPWRLLLIHNVIEKEHLIAEKRPGGLAIKAENSGKTILILPD